MGSQIITLTKSEMDMAAGVGIRRRIMSLDAGHQDRFPRDVDFPEWEYAVNSALAEYATARYLGRFWSGVRSFGVDVTGVEVRSINRPDKALKIRSYDSPGIPYVLCFVYRNTVELKGWSTLNYAQTLDCQTITDPRSVTYLVPQSELMPMSSLKE